MQLKITKIGFLYIFLTILLGISAINTGNNLLFVLVSFLLSFMLLSGWFAKLNLRWLQISFSFPEECYAQLPTLIKITLINHKKIIPSFLVKLEFQIKGSKDSSSYSTTFFLLEKNSEKILSILPLERGYNYLERVVIFSNFPFNFFVLKKYLKIKEKFLVFPKPMNCTDFSEEFIHPYRSEKPYLSGEGSGEFKEIKDYLPAVPKKYISWKHTARFEETIKIKSFSQEVINPVLINFEQFKVQDLEKKISCITYLILENLKKGIPTGLKINGKFFSPQVSHLHKFNMLKELALYERN
ncbi:MAG: DUF58 domain-containing protein [Thermodesulfobacteriaceae bacterium]|nr:DUF58 domain-containing protein [Thermodesulfobacteriaceae bacterium]MCX8041114.1 DUF58 domain-containing protein [Thermodesulfobacteriaceae bacterium]MDW8136575.1 DUF58 domain-containing protein [Thermodesulfobacterium sp.]